MTNCMLPSGEGRDEATNRHESQVWFDAAACRGVRFGIRRVSFGGRIALARRIRELGRKAEFLEAGTDARSKIEATVLAAEVDRAYLEWGLAAVTGLEIDGAAATPEALIERGPAELAAEVLARSREECGLTDDERKN